MTQEQKYLLIKDLCSRLPYGVKVHIQSWNQREKEQFDDVVTLQSIDRDGYIETSNEDYDSFNPEEVKPYLFPLSSMTEEQKKDIFHNGKFYIDYHNSLCRFPMYEDDYDFVTMEDCLEIFNKLNKYHFDWRGLIPMGLAIDATGKNIY